MIVHVWSENMIHLCIAPHVEVAFPLWDVASLNIIEIWQFLSDADH
jgi:hypothetical protein